MNKTLILVELFEPLAPMSEIQETIGSVLARLERDGVPGLASMHFFADEGANEIGAVITFSDSSQTPNHIAMVSKLPELERFAKMIRLKEMRIHGAIDPGVEAWIRTFDGPLTKLPRPIAGFAR